MIKTDSRKIKSGDTFIAIRGVNDDGHNYIIDAINNGATRVVVEEGSYNVETVIVSDTREYLINYIKENYEKLVSGLKIIGVTGTNGKTTTCFLLYQSLNKLGIKCAYMGTIGFYIEDKISELNNTTPDILDIYEMLIMCMEHNCKYMVMEVSSQALDLKRVDGLEFDYAIFTNLTQDHLDYHKNMENYFKAKQKLFYKIKEKGSSIVNIDDKYCDNYLLPNNTNITYGYKFSDYQIIYYLSDIYGTKFKINNEEYKTTLIGKHNVYNILVVIIVLKLLSINYDDVFNTIESLKPPIGRMDKIIKDDNLIIVDYAHTPDAVEKVANTVNELNHNKIITIIGCGGNRDKTKRPIMGDIATKLSDYVIFTSDNPRNELPNEIINDMVQNLDTFNYEIEENRELAIKKGIQKLTNNDILLVLGKGHENYQIINNNKIHFDDKEIVLKYL